MCCSEKACDEEQIRDGLNREISYDRQACRRGIDAEERTSGFRNGAFDVAYGDENEKRDKACESEPEKRVGKRFEAELWRCGRGDDDSNIANEVCWEYLVELKVAEEANREADHKCEVC